MTAIKYRYIRSKSNCHKSHYLFSIKEENEEFYRHCSIIKRGNKRFRITKNLLEKSKYFYADIEEDSKYSDWIFCNLDDHIRY